MANKWDDSHRREGRDHKREEPPNSRLFIVCGKDLSDDDFQSSFSKFGTIEEIWMVKDKHSGEKKGVTYVKFSKTSEAALAMEEMNGKCIGRSPRPLKVLIAHNRDQGSKREVNEEERLLRLFVVAPRSMSEQDLRAHFSQFGDLEHITLVRDKITKESKGFGYVKYHKMSHAALAFENCDRSFKAVFADPKPVRNQSSGQSHQSANSVNNDKDVYTPHSVTPLSVGLGAMTPLPSSNSGLLRSFPASFDTLSSTGSTEASGTRLMVLASPQLNQDQLWRLFDIVPGLDYCDLRKKAGQGRGIAVVVYNNPQAASYAVEKLHGFEYPPGERLIVKLESSSNLLDGPQGLTGDPFGGLFANTRSPSGGGSGMGPPAVPRSSGGDGGPGGGGSDGGHQAAAAAAAAVAAAAAAAGQVQLAANNTNRLPADVARQMSTLMDTIAACQNIIHAAGIGHDGGGGQGSVNPAGFVGNLLGPGQPALPDMGSAQGIQPVLNASMMSAVNAGGEVYDPSYCSVKLPVPQPLAPTDSSVVLRLFFVCYPNPPPLYALKDVFGRFGGLIDVYLLHNKSYGYAKYANKASADRAVATLHGQEVCGSRLKVMVASEPHQQGASSHGSASSSSSSSEQHNGRQSSSSHHHSGGAGPASVQVAGPSGGLSLATPVGGGSSPGGGGSSIAVAGPGSCHLSDSNADVTRKRIKMDVDAVDESICD